MADDDKIEEPEVKEIFNINQRLRNKYYNNIELYMIVKKSFKRISAKDAKNILQLILNERNTINVKDIKEKYQTFLKYNSSRFDEKNNMFPTFLKKIKSSILNKIGEYESSIIKSIDGVKLKKKNNKEYYYLDKDMLFENFNMLLCEEAGMIDFCYDFENADLPLTFPNKNNTLQRSEIHILTYPISFDYPIEYVYSCTRCGTEGRKYAYETDSTKGRYICEGVYNYEAANGEPKSKICGITLVPHEKKSKIKQCYYYDISYVDEDGNRNNISGISFNKYKPGFYDCSFFNIININKIPSFHIIDVKEEEPKEIVVPEETENNFLFSLQKVFDEAIEERTGLKIYGLYPIKVAMILQKLATVLERRLIFNIQVVGDASTGKSTVLKYFSFLLNGALNLSSNGASISIPALRGTRASIILFNKTVNIVTIGFLGMYNSIHIDEANDDKDMVQSLKTFLLEDNYSYDKAGGSGIFHKRTAHVNLSENLDYNYLGQYRGMIRKTYKEMENIQIGDEEKPDWDEDWDLHLPLFSYTDNPYLHKIIKDIRLRMQLEQKWWIDGYEYALHERFPFYFYVVNTKECEELNDTIRNNSCKQIVSENFELIKLLKTESIENFFLELKQYDVCNETDYDATKKVDEILYQYGIKADARTKNFYYMILILSRIINKRYEVIEQDYDLVRWFIEKTNCKLEVVDTANYEINGPPDIEKLNKMEEDIRKEENNMNNMFSSDLGNDFGGGQYS